MIDRSDSHFVYVKQSATSVKEQTPPEGATWELVQFLGCAGYATTTTARLVWDYEGKNEETLSATHGDVNCALVRQIVGDGQKRLALVLENASETGGILGGRYEAREL